MLEAVSGKTQVELALELGVSFVAYNRWRNGRAQPRATKGATIDALLAAHTGHSFTPSNSVWWYEALRAKQHKHQHVLREITRSPDILEQFLLSLTYNSNRIEGSTLSEADTAAVLFDDVAPRNKTVTEIFEAKNHRVALDFLLSYLQQGKYVNEALVLRLHEILMNGIRGDAGQYRMHAVRIVGSYVPTANPAKVPELMKACMRDMRQRKGDIVAQLARTHAVFEQIHPFSDGNGRVGRLLMHAIALSANLPPVFVENRHKRTYLKHLNRAQLEQDYLPLEQFLAEALIRSYRIVERT